MVAILVTKLRNSNTISNTHVKFGVFTIITLQDIVIFFYCDVILLNFTDFDKTMKEPSFYLLIMEFYNP